MAELDVDQRAALIGRVGVDQAAVIQGPFDNPKVVAARPLLSETSLAWARASYLEHARALAGQGGVRASQLVGIVYIAPNNDIHWIVEPTAAYAVGDATLLRAPLIQHHHLRHRNQRFGQYAVQDFPSSRNSLTVVMPGSDRLGARFTNKSYRYSFDGVGYARSGNYLRVDGTMVPIAEYGPPRTEVASMKSNEPVLVRYTYSDGVTVLGNTKAHKDALARASGTVTILENDLPKSFYFRLRWSPKQRVWYVPGTRHTAWARSSVDGVAEHLRWLGIPTVEVSYNPSGLREQEIVAPKLEPTPHGWPAIPFEDGSVDVLEARQIQAIPRYTANDYRWHEVRLKTLGTVSGVFATNVEGHVVVAHQPSFLSPFWVLTLDGQRWGRGEYEFFGLANIFHQELASTLEPVVAPTTVGPETIAASRAEVAQRKARSRALDDVARASGLEVCPRAIFEIEPTPEDHAEIKRRAEAFAALAEAYRDLHTIERWVAGEIDPLPYLEHLFRDRRLEHDITDPRLAQQTVALARTRYEQWLESSIDAIAPRDREQARRILDFCVRDITGGRRSARAARAPAPATEPRERRVEASRVVPPLPADPERMNVAWADHVAAQPKHERPWTNVTNTSCFVRNEPGVGVTLCPTPQTKPVGTCPPIQTRGDEKGRRVMLCDGETDVLYFGAIADATVEGENMAVRQRLARAPAEVAEPWPSPDDFAAQERFLDELVPARLVFEHDRPFQLCTVSVSPPGENDGPNVRVDARVVCLRAFVDALGQELSVYRGPAAQRTIDALVGALKGPARTKLERRRTANDIGHGVFGGRSLYWLGDGANDFVGPILANGDAAAGRAKQEILERFAKPLPLPDTLPRDWTLADTIVIAALVSGEPAWTAWHVPDGLVANRREATDWKVRPEPISSERDPETRTSAYSKAALATLSGQLSQSRTTVRFRVAGPWLGEVFPSDYGARVVFDTPTGGELDVESLQRALESHQLLASRFPKTKTHADDLKRAQRRLEWAKAWRQGPKPTRAAKPKKKERPSSKLPPPIVEKPAPKSSSKPREEVTDTELADLALAHGIKHGLSPSNSGRGTLLYEAEKRGWGARMRSWLTKNQLIDTASATELGARARGRVAFEGGDTWPPPPTRGSTYSEAEYIGILDSLEHAPEAQAARALADEWTETMRRTPAVARFYRSTDDLAQRVHRSLRMQVEARSEARKTPDTARTHYARRKATWHELSRTLRASLDPSLYDQSRTAADVYPTLCEISEDLAKQILAEIYGVQFVDRRDHSRLCAGTDTLDGLARKANQRTLDDTARSRESDLARLTDARALLAIFDDVRSRGELSEKRFNLACWRLHPKLRPSERDEVRLQLTWWTGSRYAHGVAPQGSNTATEGRVVGPAGHGFSVHLLAVRSEADAIERLADEIRRHRTRLERELGVEVETESTMQTKRSTKPPRTPHSPPADRPASLAAKVDPGKLRALADSMEAKANAEISTDRLENTRRRAGMASNIRDRARRQLVLAQTLRRLADAGESGEYRYVSKIGNKADVEALESRLERAGSDRRKAANVFQYWERADPELVDIDYATFELPYAHASALRELLELTRAAKGAERSRKAIEAAIRRMNDDHGPLLPQDIEPLRDLLGVLRRAKTKLPHTIDSLDERVRAHDRFARMGIVDTESLRAALREYMNCCRGQTRTPKDDPIAVKKRELAFANIPGFFPTPRPLVERMLDEAELEPGMRVLEPSAGDGAIALAILERHPDVEVDVIERQSSLCQLLELQGFSLVSRDFLAYDRPDLVYDRILMNPPFEAKQDVEHIGHALDLLAPGGRLVAIASAGFFYRDDMKTRIVRDRIEQLGGRIEPLPPGSFTESGTGVATVIVVVDKPTQPSNQPAWVFDARPQPRNEPMSDCSTASTSPCGTKEKKTSKKKSSNTAKANLAKAVAESEAPPTPPAKPAKPKPAKSKSQAKPAKPKPKAKAEPKPAAATAKPKPKPKKKSTAAKLPAWRYTDFRNERFRYREVAGQFVVERQKDGKWIDAPVTAARAIHEKSESICSLAARILPTCNGRGRARPVRPTPVEKHAMRKFLGL